MLQEDGSQKLDQDEVSEFLRTNSGLLRGESHPELCVQDGQSKENPKITEEKREDCGSDAHTGLESTTQKWHNRLYCISASEAPIVFYISYLPFNKHIPYIFSFGS